MPFAAPVVGLGGAALFGGGAAAAGSGVASDIGEGAKDFMNVGKNPYEANPYPEQAGPQNSVVPAWAVDQRNLLTPDINAARGGQAFAQGQMQQGQARGPTAYEDQFLSDQEQQARDYDQSGALQLDREAAMGNAPSAAAYQMQQGLNQGLANQQALAGSARGAAALAQAQGNAGANMANMQQGAFLGAGQLRAQEMAQARGAYGDLASQQRAQDQARLGQGNQMSQFNANANDQYALGMGQLGIGYGNLGNSLQGTAQGYFNTGAQIGEGNANRQVQTNQQNAENYNQAMGINAGIQQANADKARENRDMAVGLIGKGIGIGGSAIPKPGGG